MTDLTEFLLARIAEDEAVDGWHTVDCGVGLGYWATGVCVCGYPDRLLAECDAKRLILDHHAARSVDEFRLCAICTETGPDAQEWPCLTLRLIALPYADHPDYRSEWKP